MTRQWLSLSACPETHARGSQSRQFLSCVGSSGWLVIALLALLGPAAWASALQTPESAPAGSYGTAASPRVLGDFSATAWNSWENVANFPWEPKNRYTREDSPQGPVVRVDSQGAASMWLRHVNFDVRREPIVSWRWRIAAPVVGANETLRERDDCAARVYFLWNLRSRADFYKTTGIGYVWGQGRRVGEVGASPYTGQIGVFTLRSGKAGAGEWQLEQRDLEADYRAFFKTEPPGPVTAVAVLTDTDQTQQRATAWYGQIFVRARR